MSRACVRVYIICLCASGVLSVQLAKEYVCQDPDTGTLHELNTTWRSTTFCGNYTCKIRRINTSQQPSKVFVSLFNHQARASTNNETNELGLTKILPQLTKDNDINDRLLNKAEIQKITELLHSVKKSDLQAVIELYNVAQEMYKDMKVDDTNDTKANEEVSGESRESKHKTSYWYEPHNEHRKVADMKPEGSELEGSVLYPYAQPQPYYYSQGRTNYPNYFTGSLLNDGRVAVAYPNLPVNTQGVPAYYQQRNIYNSPGPTPQSPCNPCVRTYQYQPMSIPAKYPPRSASNTYPYLLTYNYTSQGYNNDYKGNPWAYYDYYKNLPHPKPSQIQSPNVLEKKPEEKSINSVIKDEKSWKTDPLSEDVINEIRANIAQRSRLINIPLKKRIKLERVSKVIKLDQNNRKTRSIPNVHSEEKPSTESDISQKGIEESKVLENTEVMETYIEKVITHGAIFPHAGGNEHFPCNYVETSKSHMYCKTLYDTRANRCAPTTELGYFKIGNMSKPFPDCCPQKIEDKQR